VRIFVDTGANINTISRAYLRLLREDKVEMDYVKEPKEGTSIQFAGGRSLKVNGDRVKLRVLVGTNMGTVADVHEFLILDDDTEDLVMGVNWHNKSLVGLFGSEMTRIVDLENAGISQPNPLDFAHDDAPEDSILEKADLDASPRAINEGWQLCHFNPEFSQLNRLKVWCYPAFL
jgi:hypothetical protein